MERQHTQPPTVPSAQATKGAPLIDKSPFCMWMTKMALNRGMDADTNSLITLETMTCNVVHHSADAKEGVAAFLEKRKPVWTGN